MKETDLWHYPRTDLAKRYVEAMNIGLSSTLALFAPRRMGKTEFLRKDLRPAAEAAGYRVIYVSLWEAQDDPAHALINAIANAANDRNILSKATSKIRRGPKITLTGGHLGMQAGISIGGEEAVDESPKATIQLGQLMRQLAEGKPSVLLLVDEVQMLADEKQFGPLVAALRSALDAHRDRIKAIFTGSSQDGLRLMFQKEKAPLYQFSQQLPFPALERAFVEHLLTTYTHITKWKLDADKAWQAFEELDRVPLYFRSLMERLVLSASTDIPQALMQIHAEREDSAGYQAKWNALSPLDRAVLIQAADNGKIYGKEQREYISAYLGIPGGAMPIPTVQQAVKRLTTQGLVTRTGDRGAYAIEDPAFSAWMRANHTQP